MNLYKFTKLTKEVESKKSELNSLVNHKPLSDPEVIEKSQELDILIVELQSLRMN